MLLLLTVRDRTYCSKEKDKGKRVLLFLTGALKKMSLPLLSGPLAPTPPGWEVRGKAEVL